MRGAQIGQRLGQQAQRIKDSAVVRQGVLLIGPALDVLPGAGFDVLAGLLLVVGQAGGMRRNLAGRRLHRLAQAVQRRAHVCDHMRSRLW